MIMPLSVKNQSIETSGITNDYKEALCEFIWNGLEAHATEININFYHNAAFGVGKLSISDNGDGISYEELSDTFGAFLASKKNLMSLQMKSKANKGKGRFSFITFARSAKWITVYKSDIGMKEYEIVLENDKKEIINCTGPKVSVKRETGTTVEFFDIHTLTMENMSFNMLEPMLLKEYAWFLYLFKNRNIRIYVNGEPINYEKYINTKLSEKVIKTIDGVKFEINLVVWQESIKEKFCNYYFDSNDAVKGKETTTFNRNTIDFNHSVFVKSEFFDNKDNINSQLESEQVSLFTPENDKKNFKILKSFIASFIEKKLGIYLSQRADDAVKKMIEERKTFPIFPNDAYGRMRKRDLETVTKEMYRIEPKIFYKLKPIQEKSLLGFLNLLLSSEERENVLNIIEQIVELSPEQRRDFSDILKKTKLENIIESIKFIEDRYKVIELLKSIVYDLTEFANERNHIQKIIEHHFWLFGEQYNLASADQRMQKALENYINILYGENDINSILMADVEQERRMDIFICHSREIETSFETSLEENIIVELKAPKVPLSKKVLRQIEDYMDFVRKQPSYNSEFRRWKFIAVCKEIDEDVKSRYEAFKDKGKIGLVVQVDNYEVYTYTWDDVFKSFELRHAPILKRLKYDREQLAEALLDEVAGDEGREKVNALTEIAISAVENVN